MGTRHLLVATIGLAALCGDAWAAAPNKAAPSEKCKVTHASPSPRLVDLVAHTRAALARSAGKADDLTDVLIGSIAETSLAQALHAHYALAGMGKALAAGAVPAEDALVIAQDLARNLGALGRSYERLAAVKAFHADLRAIFSELRGVSGAGHKAADALAALAKAPRDKAALEAFDAGITAYQGRVKGFVSKIEPK